MIDKDQALVRLTQQKASSTLQATDNLGMGKLGEGLAGVLKENRNFGLAFSHGLELAASSYNSLVITPESEAMFKASAKLKAKIPHLPLPSEIFKDIDLKRQDSPWTGNFTKALDNLGEKISHGRLKWYKTETNKEALAAGGATHEYEEKVLIDANSRGKQEFEIDEITDAVIEMLIWKHRDTQLASWLCNKPSQDPKGGMGWVDNYDHLSDELRKQAGFS